MPPYVQLGAFVLNMDGKRKWESIAEVSDKYGHVDTCTVSLSHLSGKTLLSRAKAAVLQCKSKLPGAQRSSGSEMATAASYGCPTSHQSFFRDSWGESLCQSPWRKDFHPPFTEPTMGLL